MMLFALYIYAKVSDMLPEVFNEWKIRLYLRKELDEAKTDKLRG